MVGVEAVAWLGRWRWVLSLDGLMIKFQVSGDYLERFAFAPLGQERGGALHLLEFFACD